MKRDGSWTATLNDYRDYMELIMNIHYFGYAIRTKKNGVEW